MPAASVGKCDAMSIGLVITQAERYYSKGSCKTGNLDKEVVVNGLSEDQAWSACQTAAGRALWKHAIHDPLADVLAGETYLRNLHEKIKKDIVNNARETSGVIVAV
ncbi:hypothetical protein JHK87_047660 [Glycine soja]|nr:hypothetical protein JHK87_047660 [Glycine soja]